MLRNDWGLTICNAVPRELWTLTVIDPQAAQTFPLWGSLSTIVVFGGVEALKFTLDLYTPSLSRTKLLLAESCDAIQDYKRSGIVHREPQIIPMSHFEYDKLPIDAKRSIQGIRGVEDSLKTLQKEYELAVFDLERKWSAKFRECYDRRLALLSGTALPTEEEITAGETKSQLNRPGYQPLVTPKGNAGAVSVENYWLNVFYNSHVDAYIAETDIPAIQHLINVGLSYPSQEESSTPAFRLDFRFSPNKFFRNAELTLTFYYKAEVNFAGRLQFSHVTADKIDWVSGRNLIEIAAQSGDPQNPNDPGDESFFSIFDPPAPITVPAVEGINKDEEFDRSIALAHVFNFGLELKQMVLPNTVDYLLGEVEDDDDDVDEWDEYESDGNI